jgi:hypothetical protein
MWHRVEVVLTDVSEERIASIFRVVGENRKIRTRSVRQRRKKLSTLNMVNKWKIPGALMKKTA